MHQHENQRRWRGYHILETLARDIRRETPWEPLNPPTHAKPTRGMYDMTHDWYDQTAGPREHMGSPRMAIVIIDAIPALDIPREELTITPTWIKFRITDLHRHQLYLPVREYARGDATYRIASYWPSRNQVGWSNAAPKELRDACLVLADATPPSRAHGHHSANTLVKPQEAPILTAKT
jgi:hypothetical protein